MQASVCLVESISDSDYLKPKEFTRTLADFHFRKADTACIGIVVN